MLSFPGPRNTATGEDLVEFHCHGGRAVVEAVERALLAHDGLRAAEPGEFTRRALLNGCIDLTEAEGLADLLEAETEQQRRSAMAAAEGQVSRALRGWLDRLSMLSAQVEASIDYAEEGDVEREAAALDQVVVAKQELAADIVAVLAAPPVERWRDGFRVVVAGPPNAGKSTLVNALGARNAAIVSPIAGTTRDRVEVAVRRNGAAYLLIDTAGLREKSDDPIEQIGMARSTEAMASADLLLWLGDDPAPAGSDVLDLWSRADLPSRSQPPSTSKTIVSANDLDSVEQLWTMIEARQVSQVGTSELRLSQRSRIACETAQQIIALGSNDAVMVAEHLRLARQALGKALGFDATEMMLSDLFSRFCVGK